MDWISTERRFICTYYTAFGAIAYNKIGTRKEEHNQYNTTLSRLRTNTDQQKVTQSVIDTLYKELGTTPIKAHNCIIEQRKVVKSLFSSNSSNSTIQEK